MKTEREQNEIKKKVGTTLLSTTTTACLSKHNCRTDTFADNLKIYNHKTTVDQKPMGLLSFKRLVF